jgi:hypothetical protein
MKQRGRKSSDTQSTVVSIVPGSRPEPSKELTLEQAAEWRIIVGRMPVGFFMAESFPLLRQLCRHICIARLIGRQIEQETLGEIKRFDRLAKMHANEGRAIVALMRAMRLTNRSRYNQAQAYVAAHSVPPGPKPWETGNDAS